MKPRGSYSKALVAYIQSGTARGEALASQLSLVKRAKDPDLTAADMDAAVRTIAGSARSMGLEVEGV